MSAASIAFLNDRAVVHVGGADAGAFLQGLITNDMALLDKQPAIYAGLLSPQGKMLFDFVICKSDGGFLLATARAAEADLVKRLAMYKLRAKVEIVASSAQAWPDGAADPRLPGLEREVVDSDAHRISLGVPEPPKDYAFGELFPHEAMFDQLGGVSFTKGCYVGQEIVARMQHRGTARSRFLIADADAPLPPVGTPVLAGDRPLGQMGSHAGNQGLVLVRLDRLADAYAAKAPVTTDGIAISLTKPAYVTFEVPTA